MAWEERALDRFESDGPLLLFYVNSPSIVLGKNQNPWREAATGWARRHGIPIARRISGGGAVWHDEGNLNFSLILSRADYKQEIIFARTLDALRDFGVCATIQNGNSIFVDGRKISGTAFCFRRAAVLHHGTMLVRSDLARLRRALMPALPEIVTRAIPSRPASVANLSEFNPTITHERLAHAIAGWLVPSWGGPIRSDPEDSASLSAWEWVWGQTPAFEWRIAEDGPRVRCESGRVTQIELPDGRDVCGSAIPFERHALADVLRAHSASWAQAALARDW